VPCTKSKGPIVSGSLVKAVLLPQMSSCRRRPIRCARAPGAYAPAGRAHKRRLARCRESRARHRRFSSGESERASVCVCVCVRARVAVNLERVVAGSPLVREWVRVGGVCACVYARVEFWNVSRAHHCRFPSGESERERERERGRERVSESVCVCASVCSCMCCGWSVRDTLIEIYMECLMNMV
jgi:hypothetical protein